MLHREKAALNVDVKHAVPSLDRQFYNPANFGNPDVIAQYVYALEVLQACVNEPSDLIRLRDISLERNSYSAFRRDDVYGFLRGFLIDIDAKNAGTLTRETASDRLSVPPTRSDRSGSDNQRILFE